MPLQDLPTALKRADEFEQALCACFDDFKPLALAETSKTELCFAALLLSCEHATVLRGALASEAPNSAAALFRLQFEALVRAVWIQYAASEAQIQKLAQPISEEAELAAKNLPGQQDMVAAIAKSAPYGLATPLSEINENIRNVLNSYVHAGLHPLRRQLTGFPSQLLLLLLRQSNRLLHHSYRVMALLHKSQPLMDRVTNLHTPFSDCTEYQLGNDRPASVA